MDWQKLQEVMKPPEGLTPRGERLWKLFQVFSGKQYDQLQYEFTQENNPGDQAYIELDKRRPNVRTNMCRTVVDDTVALLFSDTHWPSVQGMQEGKASQFVSAFIAEANVAQVMQMAAARGSIGSAAILFETFENRPKLTVLDVPFLYPEWSSVDGMLTRVTERIVYTGRVLLDAKILTELPKDATPTTLFVCQCEWERDRTIVYHPAIWSRAAANPALTVDIETKHDLGFVPIVWMKNIDTHTDCPDGDCSFERAIDTVITADYALSQGGRALRYGADPLLVIGRDPNVEAGDPEGSDSKTNQPKSPARALMLEPGSNAKLLEISGAASESTLNYYHELRAVVLEQLHGNKTHPDKLAASQSGRAMEMMAQSLVWAADRLRLSYGDGGLLPLLKMAAKFSSSKAMAKSNTGKKGQRNGLLLDDQYYFNIDLTGMKLHWPQWYQLTSTELSQLSQALATAVDSGIVSRETACTIFANSSGAEPISEWALVKNWVPADPAGDSPQGQTENPKTTKKVAGAGKKVTRDATA